MTRPLTVACLALAIAVLLVCAGCEQTTKVVSKSLVDDYSWSELSAISDMIASCANEGEALETAKAYHLVTSEGLLDGTQVKTIELADGRTVRTVIAGFNQDARPDGTAIGITFLFEDAVSSHNMNGDAGYSSLADETEANVVGAWAACEMRKWLNGEFAELLPADLRASIVAARKAGIAVSQARVLAVELEDQFSEQAPQALLQTTDDALWLPSSSELAGAHAGESSDQHFAPWESLAALEGGQYKLLADTPGFTFEGATAPETRGSLWLRTPTATSFAVVLPDGAIDRYHEGPASEALGAAPGFCL